MHVSAHACLSACVHACMRACLLLCMRACLLLCMCAFVHMSTSHCEHAWLSMHAYMEIHEYMLARHECMNVCMSVCLAIQTSAILDPAFRISANGLAKDLMISQW